MRRNLIVSEEQLKVFIDAVKADQMLLAKLKSAQNIDTIVEIATEIGLSLGSKDIHYIAEKCISDQDLETVNGGLMCGGCSMGVSPDEFEFNPNSTAAGNGPCGFPGTAQTWI